MNRIKPFMLASAMLLLLTLSTVCLGAEVSGRVYNGADGQPFPGIAVALHQGAGGTRWLTTDDKGEYKFGKVDPGFWYSISTELSGYDFAGGLQVFFLPDNNPYAAQASLAFLNGSGASPLETPEFFVRQQYLDLLKREPDEGGLNFWSAALRACQTLACRTAERKKLLCAFVASTEYQDRFGGSGTICQ